MVATHKEETMSLTSRIDGHGGTRFALFVGSVMADDPEVVSGTT